jgi:hypothetical protein
MNSAVSYLESLPLFLVDIVRQIPRPVRLLPYPDSRCLILLIFGRHFGKQQPFIVLLDIWIVIFPWNVLDI